MKISIDKENFYWNHSVNLLQQRDVTSYWCLLQSAVVMRYCALTKKICIRVNTRRLHSQLWFRSETRTTLHTIFGPTCATVNCGATEEKTMICFVHPNTALAKMRVGVCGTVVNPRSS
jgi:hypothetical protein